MPDVSSNFKCSFTMNSMYGKVEAAMLLEYFPLSRSPG